VTVDHGVPAIIRLVTAACVDQLAASADGQDDIAELFTNPLVKVLSNSHFVAAHAQALLGITSEVIYPLIQLEDSVASDRAPDYITFVNPHPLKGLSTALRVAERLPHRQFIFAESWPLRGRERKELDAQLAKLPNVSLRRRSPHLRDLYSKTALLFMPSQCQEAFGRVVIEACANGIPVVASRVGGIPEAVGEAGVLLGASDPPERWADEIEHILRNRDLYSRLSANALANAHREEFRAEVVTDRFIRVMKNHMLIAADSVAR
jgi:glycosyltransferase involved in cell wall biosynthesis